MAIKKLVRQICMLRDQRKCRKCQKYFNGPGLQLHHVLPQRLNGPDEAFNLVSLCEKCHVKWHRHETKQNIQWDAQRAVKVFYMWLNGDDLEVLSHQEAQEQWEQGTLEQLLDPNFVELEEQEFQKKVKYNNRINRRRINRSR